MTKSDEYMALKTEYDFLIDQIFMCYEFNEKRRKHLSRKARKVDEKLNKFRQANEKTTS